jgi:Ca2+-binding RTX toxin-like protein
MVSEPAPVVDPTRLWTLVYDASGTIIVKSDTGERVQFPTVKSDGSVSLAGTTGSDVISVERVASLDSTDTSAGSFVYFITSAGPVALGLPALKDVDKLSHIVDQNRTSLADAQERLNDYLHEDFSSMEDNGKSIIDSTQQQVDNAQRMLTLSEESLQKLQTVHDFILYRLDGVYEVFVEVTPTITPQSRIWIDAGNGADVVTIANTVPIRTTVTGGAGADKLTSGSRRTLLSGGSGRDRLFSRSKQGGLLAGGTGADRYYNRFGEVEIVARADGDSVMVNNAPVTVAQPGVFGVGSGAVTVSADAVSRCYYLMTTEEGTVDLLAQN